MSTALRRPMTPAEFLAWEARQEVRHEFDGIAPVAMTGGTAAHSRIQRNLAISVGGRLRGGRCEFLGSDFKVAVAGRVRYPDGTVVCSPLRGDSLLTEVPVVVFEVLSRGTAQTDYGQKNRDYEATPSVLRYVILHQDGIGGTVFERRAGDWIGHILRPDAVLRMPEIGIELPLAELYDGVDFDPTAEGSEEP